ncbi:MAG: methyltransferase [Pseudomonadota bacterium]
MRLTLALDSGALVLPESGDILVLHPSSDSDLSALPSDRLVLVQPFRPEWEAFRQRGFDVHADVPSDRRFAGAIVFLSRAKALSRALVAQAVALSDGMVLVDGAKTDGIEAMMKAVRARCPVSGALSKAHGKIFWFPPTPDLADWQDRPIERDGWFTLPGVFSADAVDPGSALLAVQLPDRLGGHVVDLGAGWGYLSKRILETAQVHRLDLVEADDRALRCARRNVSDPRAHFHWADANRWRPETSVDTVVTNPPFHTSRAANPDVGRAFIAAAAAMLKPSGHLYLVANRHLPYETMLCETFSQTREIGGDGRFKLFKAERPSRRRR